MIQRSSFLLTPSRHGKSRKAILVGWLLAVVAWHGGHAQEILEAELYGRMDFGEELMKQGKYEEANGEFLFVLNNLKVLPSEMAYLFGRNSYHLEKYKQSINWLNKYMQIKGTRGRHYESATKYLRLSEGEYREIQRKKNEEITASLNAQEYDCGGLEHMICPVCNGNGVIIKKGYFENIYKTCPYSAGEPYLTCEEYNLFMRGLMEPKIKE